jgi:TonB family protein
VPKPTPKPEPIPVAKAVPVAAPAKRVERPQAVPVRPAQPVVGNGNAATPARRPTPVQGGGSSATKPDIGAYHRALHSAINSRWIQPRGIYSRQQQYTKVNLTIRRDGSIAAYRVVGSSKNQEMDQSVLGAINNVGKLPPLPNWLPGATYNVTINFTLD